MPRNANRAHIAPNRTSRDPEIFREIPIAQGISQLRLPVISSTARSPILKAERRSSRRLTPPSEPRCKRSCAKKPQAPSNRAKSSLSCRQTFAFRKSTSSLCLCLAAANSPSSPLVIANYEYLLSRRHDVGRTQKALGRKRT